MKDAHSTVLGFALGLLIIGASSRFLSAPKKVKAATPIVPNKKIRRATKKPGTNLFVMKTGHA